VKRIVFLASFSLAVAAAGSKDMCPAVVASVGGKLGRTERIHLALARLAAQEPRPASLEEAYARLAEAFRTVEKEHFPAATVDEAFRVYDYANGASDYDETAHPKVFSEILKPPARRYAWKMPDPDREIIFQLEHITVFHRSGATEVQRIDPAVRAKLADRKAPSVLAVHDDPVYVASLPTRDDLVIFRRAGQDGRGVW
jgi:hypothetical protein